VASKEARTVWDDHQKRLASGPTSHAAVLTALRKVRNKLPITHPDETTDPVSPLLLIHTMLAREEHWTTPDVPGTVAEFLRRAADAARHWPAFTAAPPSHDPTLARRLGQLRQAVARRLDTESRRLADFGASHGGQG
jgi:hypothetical protein